MNNNTDKHIIIVDDEEDILELIEYNLKKDGFNVSCANSGESALKEVREKLPDLLLLDLMLPGISGIDVCRILKNDPDTKNVRIIMLTAKGEEEDIVIGLESGADDYVTKPFSPKVLIARINALLRRSESLQQKQTDNIIIYNELEINTERREVKVDAKFIELTYTEFQILELISANPGRVYTRNQIIDSVRGDNYPVTDRAVDFQIVGLRKKLAHAGKYIKTVRGVGYKFIID